MRDKETGNAYQTISERKLNHLCRRKVQEAMITRPMINFGNTCFFNSIIQCLVHTRPLYNFLLVSETHRKERMCTGDPKLTCFLCIFADYVRTVGQVSFPNSKFVLDRIHSIWSDYTPAKKT
jgi:ubiquitin C-terminal hydrolase